MDTFYRVHWDDALPVHADHACASCQGTGWADCERGYSCADSPEELQTDMHRRAMTGRAWAGVVPILLTERAYRTGAQP